mmetsp:Transcript_44367/g.139994  ORF Transcript_44367/g.139994 Transcript_44367/m.139994 type:complete len:133 (-) Transcript_44367:2143-2541(-)
MPPRRGRAHASLDMKSVGGQGLPCRVLRKLLVVLLLALTSAKKKRHSTRNALKEAFDLHQTQRYAEAETAYKQAIEVFRNKVNDGDSRILPGGDENFSKIFRGLSQPGSGAPGYAEIPRGYHVFQDRGEDSA